jgi:hypothetical protein
MKNFPRPRPEPTSEKFLVVCDICGPWSTRHTTAEHLVAHRSPRRRAPATWGPCSTHDDLCPARAGLAPQSRRTRADGRELRWITLARGLPGGRAVEEP